MMIKAGERSLVPDEFAYVVGCDGARSTCRHLTQVPFPGSEYPSHWIVYDAKLDWPFDNQEMQLFLHEDGVSAFFPLPRERMRVICELKPNKEGGDPPAATYELALSILQKRIDPSIKIDEPQDISPFIIHHRQVSDYQKGRVFLAGDAAHLHSLAGGQGMNTEIQDAFNLAWKLGLVMKGKAHESLLEAYHKERHLIAKDVLSMADRLTKVMTTKVAAFSFMRDAVMSFVGSFDKITGQLPKRLSQLYYTYEANDLLINQAKDHPPEYIEEGGRAPDHTLTLEEKEIRFFDLFKGPYYTLLLFAGKKPTDKDLQLLLSFHLPQVKTFYIYRNESDLKDCPESGMCLLDRKPSCHTHYGITKTTAVLVRPDNMIGLIQEPPNLKNFKNYLSKVFI